MVRFCEVVGGPTVKHVMPLEQTLDLLDRVLQELCVIQIGSTDTLGSIANQTYQKLTTVADIKSASNLDNANIITTGNTLSIPVKCFCGDPKVSRSYGLFTTYVVQATDQLAGVATNFSVDATDLSKLNSDVTSLTPDSIIFIPTRGIPYLLFSCLCNFELNVLLTHGPIMKYSLEVRSTSDTDAIFLFLIADANGAFAPFNEYVSASVQCSI